MRRRKRTYLDYQPMTISPRWRIFWKLAFIAGVVWAIGWGDGGMVFDNCQSGCNRPPPYWFKSHLLQRVP
jgi:hypothetical protein